MSSKLLTVLLLILIVSGITANSDLERMTADWANRYPESLPNWLTPEESLRIDEIGIRIDPTDPPIAPLRGVAEFDPMSGVLIRYPGAGYQLSLPYSLVAEMSTHVTVYTIVSGTYQYNQAVSNYASNGVNLDNCEFIVAPTNSFWTRDYGPFYVFDGNDELGIVNFSYNRPRPNDDNIPVVLADYFDLPLYGMNIVHTGGNYMSNGYGTAASTQIVYTENSSLTPSQVDQYVEDFLGITDHIVVQDPTGTYIDHIDTWAKFLAPDKIMIRSVPSNHSQYQEIEDTVDYFASLTSPYGTPYRIYRVYTPQNQPYTNSLILNHRVYVPLVNSTWDSEAIASFEEAMPGYDIVGINFSGWQSTDALHCRTKEIADSEMLYIRHYPILEEQPYNSEGYALEAYIYPFSGEPLYADSLKVYYRINSEAFQSLPLTGSGDNIFSASITEFAPGDTISYYLSAADHSGRTAKHPFIGAPDPHRFMIVPHGVPPIIYHSPLEEVYISDLPLSVETVVTDPAGVSLVELEYRVNESAIQSEEFDNTGGDTYSCEIGYDFAVGDLLEYRIIATNMEEPSNTSFSPEEGWYVLTIDILQVSAPVFSPEEGIYEENIYVTIGSAVEEALIYYTVDGSAPNEESHIYTDPIYISETTLIRAIAHSENYLPSVISSAEYTIKKASAEEVPYITATKLYPAYPNPFNPAVNITFSLGRESFVKLEVFNIKGKKIKTLAHGMYSGGEYRIVWDGRDDDNRQVAAGIYLYRLQADGYQESRKMILLK